MEPMLEQPLSTTSLLQQIYIRGRVAQNFQLMIVNIITVSWIEVCLRLVDAAEYCPNNENLCTITGAFWMLTFWTILIVNEWYDDVKSGLVISTKSVMLVWLSWSYFNAYQTFGSSSKNQWSKAATLTEWHIAAIICSINIADLHWVLDQNLSCRYCRKLSDQSGPIAWSMVLLVCCHLDLLWVNSRVSKAESHQLCNNRREPHCYVMQGK